MKKKLMSKILSVLLSVSILTLGGEFPIEGVLDTKVAQASVVYKSTVNGITWGYNLDQYGRAIDVQPVELTGMKAGGTVTSIVIPSTLDGHNVISIENNAFKDCSKLTSVTIPSTITEIKYSAFEGCTGLTSIVIPNSVKSIGASAFSGCSKLTSITLPSSLAKVDVGTFAGCSSLSTVKLPSTLTSIGNNAFKGCTAITEISLPIALKSIGSGAFYGCTNLTRATLPAGITAIASETFRGCINITSVSLPAGLLSIGNGAFRDCAKLVMPYIPSKVTTIDDNAFLGCSSIKSIGLPAELTKISNSVFANCSSLESVQVPGKVTTIGSSAFYKCTSLKSMTVPSSVTSINSNCVSYCTALATIQTPSGSYASTFAWLYGKISIIPSALPLTVTSLTADVSSPRPAGTVITLTSTSSGGTGALLTKFVLYDGTTWSMIRDYSSVKTAQWRPLKPGTYTVYSSTKDSTGTVVQKGITYVINNVGLCIDKFSIDKTSPQALGSTVNLSSVSYGGTGTLQTRFCTFDGTKWVIVKDYSVTTSASWKPLTPGNYTVYVDVKDTTGKVVTKTISYKFIDYTIPLSVTNLTADKASPQALGSSVVMSAPSVGGTGIRKTKFDVYDGATWTNIAPYLESEKCTWKPTKAGNYIIKATVIDPAGKTLSKQISYTITAPVLAITSFKTNLASPQTLGSVITLSATGTGNGILNYKFSVYDGTKWSIIKDFSSLSSTSWKPTKAGTYTLSANLKDSSGTITTKNLSFTINNPLTINSFSIDKASPQILGTTLNLTSSSSGGSGTLQTRFCVFDGAKWIVVKDYSATTSTSWKPTAPGAYTVYIDVKDTAGKIATKTIKYIINNNVPLTINSFTTSVASPQLVGSSITLTAASSGGTGTRLTQLKVFDGKVWTTVQNYAATTSNVWKPTKAGSYSIFVTVKDSLGNYKSSMKTFVINDPLRVTSLAANLASPQNIGKSVTLSATGTGVGTLKYKFSVNNGISSTAIKDYSTSSSVLWTPSKAGVYTVTVGVMDSSTKATYKSITYTIIDPTAPVISSYAIDKVSPQILGTTLNLSSSSSGGTGTLLTRFSVYDGTGWITIKDYSATTSTSWKPSKVGTYNIWIDVKDTAGKVTSRMQSYIIK